MKQKIALAGRLASYLQQPEAQSAWETSGVFHIWQQKTGRTFPDYLSCAGIDGWFCVTDYRYSNWPQDGKKRNLCL